MFADRRGGVPEGFEETADRRPRDRLGGDGLSQPHRAPVRLHPHPRHLHADQPQRATSPQTALAEGNSLPSFSERQIRAGFDRHTRSGGGSHLGRH